MKLTLILTLCLTLGPACLHASLLQKLSGSRSQEAVPFASFQEENALPLYDVDSTTLFQSGRQLYASMLEDMRQAEHHIHCEYFIFANDSLGNAILQIMREKARAGVECRLVIDGYYDRKRGYDYRKRCARLRKQGIDVRIYSPYSFPYLHRACRDHRKIVVIDGRIGYAGGFNVADYNLKGKPDVYGSYIDTHVRVEGSVVEGLQHLFAQHYEWAGGESFGGDAFHPYTAAGYVGSGECSATVLERSRHIPGKKREMRQAVVRLIDSAQDSLRINSPYMLPVPCVRRALRRALHRGVKVDVLFSERGDTPLLDAANVSYARSLQRRGARVWLYRKGFLHSKTMTVDGRYALVGSVNLDSRALRWNEEVALVLWEGRQAQWLDSVFQVNCASARQLNDEYYGILPFSKRIKGFFANYLLTMGL